MERKAKQLYKRSDQETEPHELWLSYDLFDLGLTSRAGGLGSNVVAADPLPPFTLDTFVYIRQHLDPLLAPNGLPV